MNTSNKETVSGLKHLVSICNDGKEGYQNASEDVESTELKTLFNTYSIQRSEFAMELEALINKYGKDSDNDNGGPLGALHRTWIDIKSALTSKENKAVLGACITGEKAALKAYDEALEDEETDFENKNILIKQRQEIADALSTIERLEKQYES